MTENEACLLFSLCDRIGPKTFLKLLNAFGSAKSAWEGLDSEAVAEKLITQKLYEKFRVFKKEFNLQVYLDKLKKTKVRVIGYTDSYYPESLKQLDAPPIVLYCKGNVEILKAERKIGIVGARKITSYGKDVTEKLTSELVFNGFTIVSGLAFGVDVVSHKTALEHNGETIAVLGCGVDCCTPAENQNLYEHILDSKGLILSEYSLGFPPSAGLFPARNRIIAGLSLGVLITEAAEDSGSLITAEEARKLNRPVFAVPGSIHSHMSKGAIKLLKEGAFLASTGKDILEQLKYSSRKQTDLARIRNYLLTSKEKLIIDKLQEEALTIDILAKKTQISMMKLMVIISSLEMRGIVENRSGEIILK